MEETQDEGRRYLVYYLNNDYLRTHPDIVLVYLPQLTARKQKLGVMASRLPKVMD